jgi:hypothetical protein
LHPNQEHETFQVSDVRDKESCSGSVSEQLSRFLSNLMHEYSAPSTHQTETRLSNDSVSSPVAEKTVLSSQAMFGPAMIVCTFLFGLSAVILGLWYF